MFLKHCDILKSAISDEINLSRGIIVLSVPNRMALVLVSSWKRTEDVNTMNLLKRKPADCKIYLSAHYITCSVYPVDYTTEFFGMCKAYTCFSIFVIATTH